MITNDDQDSSSSEDEISRTHLQEATDPQFLSNKLFIKNVTQVVEEKENDKTAPKPSLRKLEVEKFDNFGVTTTFQKFVAKKLHEVIERSIQLIDNESQINEKQDNSQQSVEKKLGIKLLSISNDILTTNEISECATNQKRKRRKNKFDELGNALKCKEAAVDGETILSQEDTKAWNERRKSHVYRYKKSKNGILMEQE